MDGIIGSEIVCVNAVETMALGSDIAKILPANSSIALIGDLGSGKTTFVKGIAVGLGIRATVTSPSFNIFNIFQGDATLIHVDAYRLDGTERATSGLMLEDFLSIPYCLVVEWPERLHGFLNRCDLKISFEACDSLRKITIAKTSL
jgi:tRNA threonylcarbamoyladenosine biosynthesis protein TsaE